MRRHADEGSSPTVGQPRRGVLEGQEGPDDVQVESGTDRLDVGQDQRAHVQRAAGGGHDAVEATRQLRGLRHDRPDLVLVGDVAREVFRENRAVGR